MNLTKADRDKLRELRERFRIESPGGLLMHPNCRCAGCQLILAMHNALPDLLDDLDAAEAEKKRLREALERIANAHDEHIHVLFHYQDEASRTGAMHVLDWAQCIAKAALAEPEAHP